MSRRNRPHHGVSAGLPLPEDSGNMLKRLWTWASNRLATDVPAEIAACLDCEKIQCVEAEFRNCPNRLARLAAIKGMPKPAPGTNRA